MSDLAKKAREAMKAKAKRLGSDRPLEKVDSSTFTPPELLDADVKTGLRPISKRAYKRGGKVQGECAPARADRKARKNGGEATSYANAKINRNVKDANELREGKKHVGGLKKGGRVGKDEGGGLYEGNRRVVSPTAYKAVEYNKKSDYRSNEKPEPSQKDEGMTAEEAEAFMKSRKSGGRAKKNIGGMLKYLSPVAMLASLGKDDKDEKKRGGRAKKQAGGPMAAGNAILQGSAAASGVPQDRLNFAPGMPSQGVKKFLGLKKGGKAEHPDEAMDKALIKKMVRKEARTGKMKGGEVFSGKSYPGKVPGVTGGRKAKADGGSMRDRDMSGRIAKKIARNERVAAARPHKAERLQAINAALATADPTKEGMRSAIKTAQVPFAPVKQTPPAQTARAPMGPGRAAAPAAPAPQQPPSAALTAAKKGGRVKKFAGGSLGYAQGGMPMGAPMPSRGGSPAQGGTMGPRPMPQQGRPMQRPLPMSPQGYGDDMRYPPVTGGPLPPYQPQMPVTGGPLPMYNKGGRVAYKKGGKIKKGKTNINIVIQAGKPETAGMDVMNPMMAQPAPPPPAPPIMPPDAGAPPPGMPPMPPGGAPGMPPMMGRKTGGRVSKEASSYKDMTAGAGSGEGRLQKTDIAKRSNRRAGGKVYRSYKDIDAGAGSGLGRLEKTEIQSRK